MITIDENKLKYLIESDLILQELNAMGVDNWIGYDECKFPDIDDIEKELNKQIKIEQLNIKETDTIRIIIDQDIFDLDEAQSIYKMFTEIFPTNRIFINFKGMGITIEEN